MPFYKNIAIDEQTYEELCKFRDSIDFTNQKPSFTAAVKKLLEDQKKASTKNE